MAKQKGRAMLISVDDGAGGFTPFAGMTSKTLNMSTERIDATTPDPVNPTGPMWKDSVDGVKTFTASGSFTVTEDAAETNMVAAVMSDDGVIDAEIFLPGTGTFGGTFAVSMSFTGDGMVGGTIELENVGQVILT